MTLPAPTYLPNLLSGLRIALAPAMLGAAYSNSHAGFTALLAFALVSDALDGCLARRWNATSAVGQRLDRWGDGLTTVAGALGVSFLWLDIVEREWHWMLVAVIGYGMCGLQRWIEPATERAAPGWLARVCGWAVPLSLVPLVGGWTALPFQAAAVLHASLGGWRLAGVQMHGSDEEVVEKKLQTDRAELTADSQQLRGPKS